MIRNDAGFFPSSVQRAFGGGLKHGACACGERMRPIRFDQGIGAVDRKTCLSPAAHAEPALRRAVPTLIIAFLITICLGAFVQVIDQSRQKRAAMKRDISALTDLLAERLDRLASVRQDRAANIERLQSLLPRPDSGVGRGQRPPRHHHRRRLPHSGPRPGRRQPRRGDSDPRHHQHGATAHRPRPARRRSAT